MLNVGDEVIVKIGDFESIGTILYIRQKKYRGDYNIMVRTKKLFGTQLAELTHNVPCEESELIKCK